MLKSKTIWFGLLVTILGALQVYLPSVQTLFDDVTYGILTAIIGVLVIVLRYVTTVPLEQK
ncbi:MAG: hypothetical protein V5B36_00945 [Candidatus Accumulibacter sp. UW25]|jgi:hypothetical protein